MAKDVDSPSGDEEEFQFSEAEESHPSSMNENVAPSPVSGSGSDDGAQKRKKILLIIGLIAAVFCIYKLYGLFAATSEKVSKAPLAGIKFEENKPSTPAPSTKTESPQFPTDQNSTQQNSEQKSELKLPNLSTANTSNTATSENNPPPKSLNLEAVSGENTVNPVNNGDTQKLSSLQKSQDNLQTQISGLSSAINGIQNNISMLTQQVNQVVTEKSNPPKTETKISEQKKEEKPVDNKAQNTATPTNTTENTTGYAIKRNHYKIHHVRHGVNSGKTRYPNVSYRTYYIRSLVQNRAWLIWGQDGTLTVSPGDMLPGYGKILSIDTDNGLVKTSSGRLIEYMPQDR